MRTLRALKEENEYTMLKDTWINVGKFSLCIQNVEKKEGFHAEDPRLQVEVFVRGSEDAEPVARLEVHPQVADVYNERLSLMGELDERVEQE